MRNLGYKLISLDSAIVFHDEKLRLNRRPPMKKSDIKYIIYALCMLAGMAVLLVLVGGR